MDSIQQQLERCNRIIKEVEAMRDLQKRYYRASSIDKGALLKQAKTQEAKVDGMILDHKRGTTQSLLGE